LVSLHNDDSFGPDAVTSADYSYASPRAAAAAAGAAAAVAPEERLRQVARNVSMPSPNIITAFLR
jgi:hypothetical protein